MKRQVREFYKEFYNKMTQGRYGTIVKQYFSPLFLSFVLAAFVLWYIAKLGYSYTTDVEFRVKIEDATFDTKCVVEGVGTHLVGYGLMSQTMTIPLAELNYQVVNVNDSVRYLRLDDNTFVNAISVRCSDIKVVSVDVPKRVDVTPRISRIIDLSAKN